MFEILVMSDKEKIEQLGGTTVVAEKIGYSVQRVQNWKARGIPSKEKLKFPEIFLAKKNEKINALIT
ncbi:helix-turn-helix domain-containing protein [Acinetobacter guillouiae]|nr:helix-turn-helix domain-containing protein [Acinetobacter guillouiae]